MIFETHKSEHKFCINCQHCIVEHKREDDKIDYKCKALSRAVYDLVTGEFKISGTASCYDLRNDPDKCGTDGKYYVKMDD